MESTVAGNFGKTSQALASKPADQAQSSGRAAQDATNDTGRILSAKLEDVRSEAGGAVRRGSRRAQSMGKQGLNSITDMASQRSIADMASKARDVASNASESIVAYTKKNPGKALAIAAASGALLYAAIKALSPSRN
jgi:ElaB/YqjD/DUF883 family membrane-anchored ribosome-binding protein